MIKNVPEQAQVKKKVFVKIGRPGEFIFILTRISVSQVGNREAFEAVLFGAQLVGNV